MCACVKLLVYASFVPLSDDTYSPTSELIKEAVLLLDVYMMRYVMEWKWGRAQDQKARVLGIGFGWATADAVLAHFLIYVLNAAGTEFTWTYIQRAIGANFTIFEWIAFGYFVWLTARKDIGLSSLLAWGFVLTKILAPVVLHEVGVLIGTNEWTFLVLHGLFSVFYAFSAK